MIRIGADGHDWPWYVDEKTAFWLPSPVWQRAGRVLDQSPNANRDMRTTGTTISGGAVANPGADPSYGMMFSTTGISFAYPVTVAMWMRDLNSTATSNWGAYMSRGSYGSIYGWNMLNWYKKVAWGSGGGFIYDPGFNPQSAGWHHYVGTYDGTTIRMYRDGADITADCTQMGGINIGDPGANRLLGVCGRDAGASNDRGWYCEVADLLIANRVYEGDWVEAVYAETKGNY